MKFDSYVITTFPGYFFQTALCIRSIRKYYPALPIYVLIDDIDLAQWPTFVDDLKQYLGQQAHNTNIEYRLFSQIPAIADCNVGWWRQQFVKCSIDLYVPGEQWLVIDADIIFNQTIAFDAVPVNVDRFGQRHLDPISIGNRKYVTYMLGIDQNILYADGMEASASAVPFRQLTQKLLQNLRKHVEQRLNQDFVQHQIELCRTQEIVGYDPTAQKMVMSEFEMIECYRAYVSNQSLPIRSIGNAHTFCLMPSEDQPYRHSSLKDWQIGFDWLHAQGLVGLETYWPLSQHYIENMPLLRK